MGKWCRVLLIAFVLLVASNLGQDRNSFANVITGMVIKTESNGDGEHIRLTTFNIRHGTGQDGVHNLDRIIDTLKDIKPGIIALNEVDSTMLRSGFEKQAEMIAQALGYGYVYGPNINLVGQYGNAIVTRYPIKSWQNEKLPAMPGKISEPRGMLEVLLEVDGAEVTVMCTHLSLNGEERRLQLNYISKRLEQMKGPKILMGDFNEVPTSASMKGLEVQMKDVAGSMNYTFPSDNPTKRIDYIFLSKEFKSQEAKVIQTTASDHLPLVADVQ